MVRTLCFQMTSPNPVDMCIMAVRHVHNTCRRRALSSFVSVGTCRIMELHTHRDTTDGRHGHSAWHP